MTYQIPTKWMSKAIDFGITLHYIKKPLTLRQWST